MCRIVAGSAGEASAGMGARAAQVKTGNRGAVLRPSRYWTHKEKLFQPQVAVEDVAFGQTVGALEIERRQYLASENCARNVGSVLRNFPYHAIAEQSPFLVPCTFAQTIRYVLHEAS